MPVISEIDDDEALAWDEQASEIMKRQERNKAIKRSQASSQQDN